MNEKEFVQRRRPDWDRLLWLAGRAELTSGNLTGAEVREFGRLYRAVSGDLAAVRTHSENVSLHSFLNDLLARCYCVLYRHPRRSVLLGFLRAVTAACGAVRRRKWFAVVAIGIFLISAVFARQAIRSDQRLLDEIVPPGFKGALEEWKKKEFNEVNAESASAGTGFYIANNTFATISAAAGGVTFGIYTVRSLYENGAIMGAFFEELSQAGCVQHFLTGVAAHGVTELGGIFIASAAGLLLGWSIIAPGRRTRLQSLRAISSDAIHMIILGITMIWVAAPIEAWVSFGDSVPDWLKLTIAGTSLVFWLTLFSTLGKKDSENRPDFFQKY